VTTPDYYSPRAPSGLDVVAYTRRVVDSLHRNNPLTDAVVSRGLIKWLGNYTNSGNPDKINYLWIGEFLPADPNLGGIAQRGFSLVRDDSRGGISAIAMFDAAPDLGGGLRQTLFITSGDNKILARESRQGGWFWPEDLIPLAPMGNDTLKWPGTQSATFDTLWEGRVNGLGNQLSYRVFAANDGGATGEYRIRVEAPGGDLVSTTHVLGAGLQNVFDSSFDIATARGVTCTVRIEARRTNAAGNCRATPITLRCHTTTV
jgi:hypothetical protein